VEDKTATWRSLQLARDHTAWRVMVMSEACTQFYKTSLPPSLQDTILLEPQGCLSVVRQKIGGFGVFGGVFGEFLE
jgi:hypothetical protein